MTMDAGTPIDETPVETLEDAAAYLASGCKPREAWRHGTEHEKFGYLRDTLEPLPYDGPRSIKAIFDGLVSDFGWTRVTEGERTIGLVQEGASISLEPGGQFELSGAPLRTLHQTCDEVHTHLHQVRSVADPLDVGFLGLGMTPNWTREEMPRVPKDRYAIMRAYMPKVGSLGLDMMHRTCTIQANLDYGSEADMVRKFRVSLALQPLATALFANSPMTEGRPNGWNSQRANIWTDTDPDRTGMLGFVFEDGFGFERYADYMLDVPMYFLRRDGGYIDCAGKSFRKFMAGELDVLPGEKPTLTDWKDHLSTAFPEVRLKTFLEMRGADGGPWSRICALPAFWVGILYDDEALGAAWEIAKDWTAEEREALRIDAAKHGLKAEIAGRTLRDVALDVLPLARSGLNRRAELDTGGTNEAGFLEPLEEIARSGETLADRMLTDFESAYGGDMAKLFAANAY